MATDLSTPSSSLVKVRWREPYASQGLNEKLNGLAPHGVIRGGRLVASALASRVTIQADPDTGDSIYSVINSNGQQMTFRQVGDVTLDLDVGGLPGTTAYIGLVINYTVGADTTVKWQGLSSAEVDADSTILCLGSADVPGVAALIPETDITSDRRTEAALNMSSGMRGWRQAIVNGSFEGPGLRISSTDLSRSFVGWWMGDTLSHGIWEILTPTSAPASQPRTGENSLLADGGGGGLSHAMYARCTRTIKVVPGQNLMASVWVRGDGVTLQDGASAKVGIRLTAYEDDGTVVTSPASWNGGFEIIEDGTVVTGTFSYIQLQGIVKVPASASHIRVELIVEDSSGFIGDISFDDFNLWLEVGSVETQYDLDADILSGDRMVSMVTVAPVLSALLTDPSDIADRALKFFCANNSLTGLEYEISDLREAATSWLLKLTRGRLRVGENVLSTAAEMAKARLESYHGDGTVGNGFTLLFQSTPYTTATRCPIRIYLTENTADGGTMINNILLFTWNARWDGTQWVRDVVGLNSQRIKIGVGDSTDEQGLVMQRYESSDASPWPETDWSSPGIDMFRAVMGSSVHPNQTIVEPRDGRVWFSNVTVGHPGSNPLFSETPFGNALYAKNIVKAWITYSWIAAVGTVNEGFNLDEAAVPGASLSFSFGYPMADTEYAVVFGAEEEIANSWVLPFWANKTTGGFEVRFLEADTSGGAAVVTEKNASAMSGAIDIVVLARQTS